MVPNFRWLILPLLASVCLTASAGLDDSGEKKITVGSEITRGYEAVQALPPTADLISYNSAALAVIRLNKQKGTDTDGFLCGASYAIWKGLKIGVDVDRKSHLNSPAAVAQAKKNVLEFFRDFRTKQHALGLTDEEFATAIGSRTTAGKTHVAVEIQEAERSMAATSR